MRLDLGSALGGLRLDARFGVRLLDRIAVNFGGRFGAAGLVVAGLFSFALNRLSLGRRTLGLVVHLGLLGCLSLLG